MNWNRFRYIVVPQLFWWGTGFFIVDGLHNFLHVRVFKRPAIWGDAVPCKNRFCRYCGADGVRTFRGILRAVQ